MRVWLVGFAQHGVEALRQLEKNEEIEVIISASTAQPEGVRQGIIDQIDYVETVTPVNINTLARRIRPDLILIDSDAESRNYSRVMGGSTLSEAIIYEIAAASEYPCLVLK